jgi:hypothetical protein
MKCTVEMASGGIIYMPSLITIGSDIHVIFRLLPQQFERLHITHGKDIHV